MFLVRLPPCGCCSGRIRRLYFPSAVPYPGSKSPLPLPSPSFLASSFPFPSPSSFVLQFRSPSHIPSFWHLSFRLSSSLLSSFLAHDHQRFLRPHWRRPWHRLSEALILSGLSAPLAGPFRSEEIYRDGLLLHNPPRKALGTRLDFLAVGPVEGTCEPEINPALVHHGILDLRVQPHL